MEVIGSTGVSTADQPLCMRAAWSGIRGPAKDARRRLQKVMRSFHGQEDDDASGDGEEGDVGNDNEEKDEEEVYEEEKAAQGVDAETEASSIEEAIQQEEDFEEQAEEAPEFDDPSYAAELLELMADPHTPCCQDVGLSVEYIVKMEW
ncbi:hypothetical protein IWX90DRAFT_481996 [Phyllosticta citrichinensis]|uniref:Uncharacterized protein n=1 Tax=Phyllosticta citrichinensis TaxID=1130410 RepID=A0ABR1Y5P4_9PEZI